jgi:hypothetical protein
MDNKLIVEFEQALKDEIEQKKRALDAEFKRRMDAFRVACGAAPLIHQTILIRDRDTIRPDNGHRFYGGGEAIPLEKPRSMLLAVKQALTQIDGEFTVRDLVPKIKEIYPSLEVATTDLSNPLWSLDKTGEIKRVKSGEGRNPHTYVKAK